MAVVARGVRSARPATAPKHRKTSTPPEPVPPTSRVPDKSGAARQQDTPAAPDATLELPAVDQPDALERLTAAAPPGTNGRLKPDAWTRSRPLLSRIARPAPAGHAGAAHHPGQAGHLHPAPPGHPRPARSPDPDTTGWFASVKPDRGRPPPPSRMRRSGSAPRRQPDPLPRPATRGKPEARDWFTPAPGPARHLHPSSAGDPGAPRCAEPAGSADRPARQPDLPRRPSRTR